MKHLQKFISLIIIIGGVFVVSKTTFASFYPVQGITYSVATTIVPTDSSITLSSFTDANKVTYTMTSFGAIGYGTLDPEYNAKIEDISFTGITANGNGTVTLTGVSRGLSFQTPYGASLLNSRTHLVGSHFILSNTGAFYGQQFAFLNNASTIKGLWTYITSPVVPDPTTALQVVNKEYADALTISGTPKADTSTGGRVQVATGLQMASSTALGTATGNPYLAITTNNATSTYGNGSTSGLKAVITQNDGRIDSNFIRTTDTSAFNIITPVGSITAYATTTPPTGWLLANGASKATSTYPALFALIGYSYGGSSANFNLPDLTQRMIRMASSSAPALGYIGGNASSTITASNLPTDSRQVIGYSGAYSTGSSSNTPSSNYGTGNSSSPTTLNASGGVALDTISPYITLNYIIKY